jgi:hypothetical protein
MMRPVLSPPVASVHSMRLQGFMGAIPPFSFRFGLRLVVVLISLACVTSLRAGAVTIGGTINQSTRWRYLSPLFLDIRMMTSAARSLWISSASQL